MKREHKLKWVAAALAAGALAACDKAPTQPSQPNAAEPAVPVPAPVPPPAAAAAVPEKWAGKWNGPEGTYLELTPAGAAWRVTVRNLDGPREFQGHAAGGGIAFERDAVKESIRAGDGVATGMKWLSDKKDCLVVKAGEGYCRD